jgi:hypothetical protein
VACVKKWWATILGNGDIGPIFCLGSDTVCNGKGTEFHSLYFDEVDEKGKAVQMVWLIQVNSAKQADYILSKLEYGKVPHGWKEAWAARPIKPKTYYSVDGEFYFWRNEKGEYTVLTAKQFFDRIQASKRP